MNPRTSRPVGYAFVDLATAAEATAAIEGLSGKEILSRKVSVQLARKPEPAEAKEGAASGGEGASGTEGRKRAGGRGRGRGRARGRGGRGGRVAVCFDSSPVLYRPRITYGNTNNVFSIRLKMARKLLRPKLLVRLLWPRLPTRTRLPPPMAPSKARPPELLAPRSSVAPLRTASLPRPRLWLPTSPMT